MKKNYGWFLLGILTSIIISLLISTAYAAHTKQATLSYNDIKIVVDGERIVPKDANGNAVEPFIIEGTTYLPVRAVASALNMDVAWDGTTKTVTLTSKKDVGTNANKYFYDPNVGYTGNINTYVFHYPGCEAVVKMSEKNKVSLITRELAISSGFSSCSICQP